MICTQAMTLKHRLKQHLSALERLKAAMFKFLEKVNWWRVAAFGLLFTSFGGFILALTTDTYAVNWATTILNAMVWLRIEWVLDKLTNAKEYEPECNPYD